MKRPAATKPLEPKEPLPEQFGLSRGEVSSIKNPPFRMGIALLAIPVVVIAFKCVGVSLWWLPIASMPIIVLGTFFVMIANDISRSANPKAEAYERYTEAVKAHRVTLNGYRQQLGAWQRSELAWWRGLNGRAFEQELASLLKSRGYHVQLTPTTNDGGIDLVLRQGTQSILVQCKAHKAPVGPGPVRDLFGTLTHRGGTQAWLVATSSFSKGADSFARGKPIRLVAIRDLLNED